jgi:hypothetical protein
MTTRTRITVAALVFAFAFALSAGLGAQGRSGGRGTAQPRDPQPPAHAVTLRGHVFIGGYFYDPWFGPYPWWPPVVYPYRYYPAYGHRADVRLLVKPRETHVYVDGFYAGIVDEFDGFFERLPLPPGGHEIALYLPGYRSVVHRIYLGPGTTFKLSEAMEQLPEGVKSEPPPVAPAVPPPPPGSYRQPKTAPPLSTPPAPARVAVGYGTLQIRVQPGGAEVTIDGQRWTSADGQHFVVEVSAGTHLVEAALSGYQRYSAEVLVRDGETTFLNVSLSRAASGK